MTVRKRLTDKEAKNLGKDLNKKKEGRTKALYRMSLEQWEEIKKERGQSDSTSVSSNSDSKSNSYKKKFVLSAWNAKGYMMEIGEYCEHYNLPKKDIHSYKLVSHTGTPFYNIVFKENIIKEEIDESVFKRIIKKYIKPISVEKKIINSKYDFDVLTYSDLHIGLDTDKYKNSMYPTKWDGDEILDTVDIVVQEVLQNKKSNRLIIDELGDFLDGFNAKTVRGGHDLPQNMTNKEMFDYGYGFKVKLIDNLVNHFSEIEINNICNDNHAGDFGYFVNQRFKDTVNERYPHIKVTNHVDFINHYFVDDICFLISHGKDDMTLKYGFKVFLDSSGMEKIDQYCKINGIYKKAKKIIFKKGDSHLALFDMSTSADFYYFNYPALSPSSQWVQNNFKKGYRGFIFESYKDLQPSITPYFFD